MVSVVFLLFSAAVELVLTFQRKKKKRSCVKPFAKSAGFINSTSKPRIA